MAHPNTQASSVTSATLTLEKVGAIAVVTFDDPTNKVNTLHSRLMPEFEALLTQIQEDRTYKGVVVISGKDSCFVAGADIEELSRAPDAAAGGAGHPAGAATSAVADAGPHAGARSRPGH